MVQLVLVKRQVGGSGGAGLETGSEWAISSGCYRELHQATSSVLLCAMQQQPVDGQPARRATFGGGRRGAG